MPDNKPPSGIIPSSDVPQKWQRQLAIYRGEIRAAKRFMEQKGYWQKWRDYTTMYSDIYHKSTDPAIDSVDVPIGFSNVNIQRSALTVNHPKFTVNPRNKRSYEPAIYCEQALNYEWRTNNFQDEIRDATDEFLIAGNAWLKAGYQMATHGKRADVPRLDGDFEPDFNAFELEGYDEAFDQLVEQSRKAHSQITSGGSELPPNSELARQLRKHGTIILQDRAILEQVSIFNMLVDPSATKLKNAQWVAQRVPYRLDVAKENTTWPSRVREQLSPGKKSIAEYNEDTPTESRIDSPNARIANGGEQMEWVIVWEFYDLHTGQWCLFTDDKTDDFLVRPEVTPHKFGHPFIFAKNYSVPNCFYGVGELERIEALQIELNKSRSALVNDRKGFRRKYMVNAAVMDDPRNSNLREVLTSEDDNLIAVVALDNNMTFDRVIARVPAAELDPNLYNVSAVIKADINEVTGITEYQRGGNSAGAATATEAAIVNDGALARMKEKQGKIEAMMVESARKLMMLKQQYMTTDRVLRITVGGETQASKRFMDRMQGLGRDVLAEAGVSPEARELYVSYGRNDIAGEFDFEIEAGSSTAFNESQRRRAAQELLATMAAFIPTGLVDVQALLSYVVQQGFGIPNAEMFLAKQQEQAQPAGPQGVPYDGGAGGIPSIAGGVLQPSGGIPQSAIGPPPNLQGLA